VAVTGGVVLEPVVPHVAVVLRTAGGLDGRVLGRKVGEKDVRYLF
jgi:hypothetical protein